MFILQFGVLRGDLVKDFVKEAISDLHDVVFREAGDLLTVVAARIFKRIAHYLLRARPRDELETLRHLIGLLVLDSSVHVFFIFAHDDDIHARMFRADERMVGNAGTNVGIKSQTLADGHVQAFETTALWRGNGRFQKHFGAPQRIPGAFFNTRAVAGQVNLFADLDGFDFELSAGLFEDVQRRGHDLGTDSVTMRHCNRYRFRHRCY